MGVGAAPTVGSTVTTLRVISLVGCAMIARIVKRLALVCFELNPFAGKRFNETRESKVVIAY